MATNSAQFLDVNVLSFSFNCGGGRDEDVSDYHLKEEIRQTILPNKPDIVVINLQECCPLSYAALGQQMSEGYANAWKDLFVDALS